MYYLLLNLDYNLSPKNESILIFHKTNKLWHELEKVIRVISSAIKSKPHKIYYIIAKIFLSLYLYTH